MIWVVQYVRKTAWNQNIELPINNYPLSTPMNVRANAGDPNNNSGTNPGGTNLSNPDFYRTFQGYSSITQEGNTTNGNYNGFSTTRSSTTSAQASGTAHSGSPPARGTRVYSSSEPS